MKLRNNLIITAFAGLVFCACGNSNPNAQSEKAKLDPSLINNPRSANTPEAVATENLATMDFVDTFHAFGKMYEGEMASYDFTFKNNGKSPLLISNASGTCGCTVPEYPKEPIAPGENGTINVKFNSTNKVGLQNKSVNIFTNSKKGTHVLNITADVIEKQK